MRIPITGVLVACSLVTVSCSSVYERFHLQKSSTITVTDPDSKDDEGNARSRDLTWTNYYRVTIRAKTQLSASQYAAGWYDKGAVDALFGELTGPGKKVSVDSVQLIGHEKVVDGKTVVGGDTAKDGADAKKNSSVVVVDEGLKAGGGGESLDDKKLVIFLSTNSSALVSQIRAFTKSERIQNSLVGMLLGPEYEKLEEQKLAAERHDATAATEAQRLQAQADALTTAKGAGTVKVADVQKALVASLKLLAQSSGQPQGSSAITDAATARKWLEDHAGAFFSRKED